MVNYKVDNDKQVFFYEQEFYVLSNFSSFAINWKCYRAPFYKEEILRFDTAEAVYHWEKFNDLVKTDKQNNIQNAIKTAMSAHDAFMIAQMNNEFRIRDWNKLKLIVMKDILHAKIAQHEYVRRKLLETGDRELIEDSWRDNFWGWGEDHKGQNQLGKLWMEVRKEIRQNKYQ